MKSYDEKFNAELRDHTVGASRRNHQKQSNIRTHNSPMSIDDSQNSSILHSESDDDSMFQTVSIKVLKNVISKVGT